MRHKTSLALGLVLLLGGALWVATDYVNSVKEEEIELLRDASVLYSALFDYAVKNENKLPSKMEDVLRENSGMHYQELLGDISTHNTIDLVPDLVLTSCSPDTVLMEIHPKPGGTRRMLRFYANGASRWFDADPRQGQTE